MKNNNVNEKVSINTQKGDAFKNIIIILLFIGVIFAISFRDENLNKKENGEQTTTATVENNDESNVENTTSNKSENETTETTTTKVPETPITKPKSQAIKETVAVTIEYSCPTGYTLSGVQCIKDTMSVAEIRYYCSSGNLEGVFCVEEIRKSVYISSTAKASCSNYTNTGLFNKCACEKSGGNWIINGCYTITSRRTAAKSEYYCEAGKVLSGSMCIGKDYATPIMNYVCPKGYTKSGMLCYKY